MQAELHWAAAILADHSDVYLISGWLGMDLSTVMGITGYRPSEIQHIVRVPYQDQQGFVQLARPVTASMF